jgi:hypothetical protein
MEVDVTGRTRIRLGLTLGGLAGAVPLTALAQSADKTASQAAGIAADTVWVVVAACLVLFMQAGFAMLEVGFSRMKNVGTVVAKIVVNLSIASIIYWFVGFAVAFGTASGWIGQVLGHSGFRPHSTRAPSSTVRSSTPAPFPVRRSGSSSSSSARSLWPSSGARCWSGPSSSSTSSLRFPSPASSTR